MARIIVCDECGKHTGALRQCASVVAYPPRHEGWSEQSGLGDDSVDTKFDLCSSECLLKFKNKQAVLEVKLHDTMVKSAKESAKKEGRLVK